MKNRGEKLIVLDLYSGDTLGGPRLGVILKLVLGGLRVKHDVNHGILVPTQNLLWDRGRL